MRYETPTTDDRLIWDHWLGHLPGAALTAALEAGLFEALADAPASGPELSERMNLNRRGIVAVLRLLAATGLLVMRGGRYQLTDAARVYLRRQSPFSFLGVLASSWGRLDDGSAHARIRDGLRQVTEPTPLEATGGEKPSDAWASGQLDIEPARQIAGFMHSHSMGAAVGAARNGDFAGARRLLDVGGGSGCFSIAFAQAHPELRCSILDLPAMCAVANDYIAAGEVADRVDTVAVDMFRMEWPRGADVLFFSNIFHDWSFETCAALAAKAYEALPSGGRIILHEQLLDDDGNGPVTTAAFSLLMFIATQGQQFTFAELKGLLEAAGFRDVEARHSYAYYSLVTGRKA